ncbi:[LysW]-aminoadipate/[LysW]-glutamate kinase [Vulcanisaeta souniana]|uniref:Putative [LysW]-aminoadipate/[LysW]-glutamate kinase n=1 Tax=Vulcanisaeta souniana JCM 11219 TaxID=1293586 RepID=A0A830E5Y0_9CREN|nr:[LysW]-aminoadipate/[LysW]-glutamate kinase [Vulcanisaeta souniana]BDR92327.1 acetylglutamate kinase [Vulcanisaeta souniana JCM 11219]GGI74746.1 acetylglutamate kinase [Vulcanisaeta souniana JCM 11219]
MLIAIKIGGSVIRKGVDNLIKEIPTLVGSGHRIVLVHGGGYFINELMEKMNLKPRFVTSPSGVTSRYTDLDTLRVYVMGMMYLNKDLVSRLQGVGVNAIGLSGVDGGLLRARRRESMIIIDERGRERVVDGGYTGKIEGANKDFIMRLLNDGFMPVVAPIAMDNKTGGPLNVDGDQALEVLSYSLLPNYAIILTDVDGVLINGKVVNKVSVSEAQELFKNPEVRGGMKRKVYTAMQLAGKGMHVVISNGTIENPIATAISGFGTHVSPA